MNIDKNLEKESQETTINNLSDYISHIQEYHSKNFIEEDTTSKKQIFYRGQANKNWSISPSICRDKFLKYESSIISDAYALNFNEVLKYENPFERLTVLQHYSLPTRLLDVTLNPLVALYFACQNSIEYKEINDTNTFEKLENDGVIYFKRAEFESYNSKNIRIISKIAELDFQQGYTIRNLLNDLLDEKIISDRDCKKFIYNCKKEFIKILRTTYFVNSNKSSKRLINQNGAFLLSCGINIEVSKKKFLDKIISKANIELKHMFDNNILIVPYERKKDILKELSIYNINRGNLFPELEYQMKYLKESYLKVIENESPNIHDFDLMVKDDDIFESIKDIDKSKEDKNSLNSIKEIDDIGYKINDFDKVVLDMLYENNIKNKDIILEQINKILERYKGFPDWDIKESIKSSLIVDISRLIRKETKCEPQVAKQISNKIYETLLNVRHS